MLYASACNSEALDRHRSECRESSMMPLQTLCARTKGYFSIHKHHGVSFLSIPNAIERTFVKLFAKSLFFCSVWYWCSNQVGQSASGNTAMPAGILFLNRSGQGSLCCHHCQNRILAVEEGEGWSCHYHLQIESLFVGGYLAGGLAQQLAADA